MGQVRHRGAAITYAVRAATQRSRTSLAQLSRGLGINAKTVAKWRNCDVAFRRRALLAAGQLSLCAAARDPASHTVSTASVPAAT